VKCCDITPGQLRSSVTIQSPTRTADGGGGFSVAWSLVATVGARVRQKSSREPFVDQRLSAQRFLECVIRYRSDVNEEQRAVVEGVAYQIRNVEDVELRKRWLVLTLEGGVAV
jgi:SPP1 family predicted phage head-tail adaptor